MELQLSCGTHRAEEKKAFKWPKEKANGCEICPFGYEGDQAKYSKLLSILHFSNRTFPFAIGRYVSKHCYRAKKFAVGRIGLKGMARKQERLCIATSPLSCSGVRAETAKALETAWLASTPQKCLRPSVRRERHMR